MADAPPPKPAPAPPPKPPAKPKESPVVIRPFAGKATRKARHWGLISAFAIMVLLPVLATWAYLSVRAVDQYASTVAFTVRSEDVSSATDLLGGLGKSFGGGGGSDSDILYEFIRSQALVAQIDTELDLRSYYSRHVDTDPSLALTLTVPSKT